MERAKKTTLHISTKHLTVIFEKAAYKHLPTQCLLEDLSAPFKDLTL